MVFTPPPVAGKSSVFPGNDDSVGGITVWIVEQAAEDASVLGQDVGTDIP